MVRGVAIGRALLRTDRVVTGSIRQIQVSWGNGAGVWGSDPPGGSQEAQSARRAGRRPHVSKETHEATWSTDEYGKLVDHARVLAGTALRASTPESTCCGADSGRAPRGRRISCSRKSEAGQPSRRSAAIRRIDGGHVEPDAGQQPGHEGIRVPHVTGAQLVASPGQRRNGLEEIEKVHRLGGVAAHPSWALNSLGDVRDVAVTPATDLVAKGSEATEPMRADRPFTHCSAIHRGFVPHRRHFDDVSRVIDSDLERGVVEAARGPVLVPGGERLVEATIPANRLTTGTQGKPIQVDGTVLRCRCSGWTPNAHTPLTGHHAVPHVRRWTQRRHQARVRGPEVESRSALGV